MRRRHFLVSSSILTVSGCAKPEPERPPAPPPAPRGAVVEFEMASLDDRPVTSAATRGRVTAVLFVTTYGDPSLLAARFLTKVYREHTPRFNAAAVFLERVENRPLARIFCDQLALPYPAAMADLDSIAGKGAFKGVDTVPALVILDRQGRETFRRVGVTKPEEVVRALRAAE